MSKVVDYNNKEVEEEDDDNLRATARDNYLYFSCPNITNFSFTLEDKSITSGQPWDAFSTYYDSNGGRIYVRAGRKGSQGVATWFRNNLNGGQALGINSGGVTFPSELNFAFKGTLSFTLQGKTYNLKNTIIGQGHFNTTNNWWIGGEEWKKAAFSFLLGAITVSKPLQLAMIIFGYTVSTSADKFQLSVQSLTLNELNHQGHIKSNL